MVQRVNLLTNDKTTSIIVRKGTYLVRKSKIKKEEFSKEFVTLLDGRLRKIAPVLRYRT